MLSKPSVPQVQLYGTKSLCLTPFLPLVSPFCSHTDPHFATVTHISCIFFSTTFWPFAATSSVEATQHRSSTNCPEKVLRWGQTSWLTMTRTLWLIDRVLSHKKKKKISLAMQYVPYCVMMNSQTENIILRKTSFNSSPRVKWELQRNILNVCTIWHVLYSEAFRDLFNQRRWQPLI